MMRLQMTPQMSQSLQLKQTLKLRKVLEQRFERQLQIKQSQKLELGLYRKRENICIKLYKKVLEKGLIKEYNRHGMIFEYALVSKRDVPKAIYDQTGWAFSHCLMNGWDLLLGGQKYALSQGSWLLFIIHDFFLNMPQEVIEYGAIHERGEMVTLGNHNMASKLEFAIAAEEKELINYMRWIEENSPSKFADVFNYQVHLELPDIDEMDQILQVFQTSQEAEIVKKMIKEFQWPYAILRKLMRYKKKNDLVCEMINIAIGIAKEEVSKSWLTISETIERVRQTIERELKPIVSQSLKKYISKVRIGEYWKEKRIELDGYFIEHIIVPKQKNMKQEDYLQEITESKIKDSLPRDNIFSMDFEEVLASL